MTKILDSTSYNGSVQKIVELTNGYIINGQLYNKSNLAPKALKFFKTFGDTAQLSMNKKLNIKQSTWGPTYKNDKPTLITDTFDPQITYAFSTNTIKNIVILHKFRETSEDTKLIMDMTYTGNPGAGAFPQAYAGQDEYYLYYIFQTNTTSGTGHFVRINKKTLELQSILNFSSYNATGGRILKENTTFIFFGYQRYFGDISLYRYNKQTNVVEAITVPNKRGKSYFGALMSEVIFDTPDVGYAYAIHQDATVGTMFINKYSFDFSKTVLGEIVTLNEVPTITWTGFSSLPVLAQNATSIYDSFIVQANDGKKVLVVALYETAASSTTTDAGFHGFYSFEIAPTGLTALGFTPISTTSTRGFICTTNKKVLVATTDSSIYFLNFDESAKKYIIANQIDALPMHVGIDQSENIWYTNTAEEVEMVSLSVPTNVSVNFEKQGYKYEGIDIPTYIQIDAKNYQGNRVSVKLELTIRGNAVFETNSTKIIQELTDVSAPKRINIIVKGSGGITIYPKLIV